MSSISKSAGGRAATDSATQSGTKPLPLDGGARYAMAAMFMELAAQASTLVELLDEAAANTAEAAVHPARDLALQLGLVADLSAQACGGTPMRGGAEDWLLSPLARQSLACLRGAA